MNLPAAIGTLRLADGVGASIDRSLIDDAYYLRVNNSFRVDLGLQFEHSELAAVYGLRLYPNVTTLKIEPFHTAELRYTYSTQRFVFSLSEIGGIGKQTFLGSERASPLAGLTPVQTPTVTTLPVAPVLASPGMIDSTVLPGVQSLLAVFARTQGSATYRWDRNLTSVFAVAYQVAGGLTPYAQRYLTLQHVVDGTLSLNYGLSARTNLVSALVVSRGWNSRHDDYALVTLSESWWYKWTSETSMDLGAGISSRLTEGPDGSGVLVTTPVGTAGISHIIRGRDATGALRLGVTYAPLVDPVTARIQNRLTVLGTATVTQGDVSAGVGANLSQVIPTDEPGAVSVMGANVFGSYQISSWLGTTLSAQITRQQYATTGSNAMTQIPSGFSWGVYGGLYAVSPTWRF